MDLTSGKVVEAWLTQDQLIDAYKSEKVAEAIIRNKTPEQCRDHPEAPGCPEARQYWCKISEQKLKKHTEGSEKGVAFKGRIDEDQKDICKDFMSNSSSSAPAAAGESIADKQARDKLKEERRLEAIRKKQAREDALQNDANAARDRWLSGIGKDIKKMKQAASDCSALLEPAMKTQYAEKFQSYALKLQQFRESLEDSNAAPEMESMDAMKKVVQNMRKDLSAFEKLKSVYGMEGQSGPLQGRRRTTPEGS